ncbi:response regulator transcription factor [bacterium]|nr:response regulator transcription factor [bacterium]
MKEYILVIDDDEKLNILLKDYLSDFGYQVSTVTHPSEGIRIVRDRPPDLVILDIMLPDMDGFEVCREIRKTSTVPVVMLTARGDVTDRVVGLEIGADDYLPKPFEPRELVARIQSVLRRLSKPGVSVIRFSGLEVDIEKQSVKLSDEKIHLTTMEFELLRLFMENPGKVFSRDQIMDVLRGMDCSVFDRSVDMLISRLRQKLNDDLKDPKWILTIRGTGYKFIGD